MTTEALSKLHQARPFQPFVLRLGDGQALPVGHAEMDGSYEIVDLLLVTGLEVLRARGSRSRRR